MSSIKMKSEDVIMKCIAILKDVEYLRIRSKAKAIETYMERKNKGFKGWILRLAGKKYDIAKARDELTANYDWDNPYRMAERFYRDEERIARSLIVLANASDEVCVSRDDFNVLKYIEHITACIKSINDRE